MKNLFTIFTLLLSLNSYALDVPTLSGPVVDKANVLTNDAALESQIRAIYNNGQGPQINILTIPSLEGDNLEQFAHKVFTTWKLGDAKRDDGLLFLLVINDRKMRIEVGQGLEGGITDLQSKRILGSLKSYLRSQDYNGGVQHGLNQIIQAASQPDAVQQPIHSTPSQKPNTTSNTESSDDGTFFLVVLGLGFAAFVFFTISRLIRGYFRNFNQAMESEQESLDRLVRKESESQKVIQRYNEKISSVEKQFHLPLTDVIKKINKETKELGVICEKQSDKVEELTRKEYSCPISKLESLKRELRSWENKLQDSKENINRHQNLINKEGK